MKMTRIELILLATSAALSLGMSEVRAQGTAFTYQGRLNVNGAPATGTYDFRYRLALDPYGNNYFGSSYLASGQVISNGLFAATLDFGAGAFNGGNYWLEVDVRTNGAGGYTALNPLQPVTPTPYAIFSGTSSNALNATAAATATTATTASTAGAVAPNGVGGLAIQNNAVTSLKIAAGQVVKSLTVGSNPLYDNVTLAAGNNVTITPSGQTLTIAASGGGWSLTGNAGTAPGNFVGTTDNEPVEFWVNGGRALRLEPDAGGNGAPNVIGGSASNSVLSGVSGATIGGGGETTEGGFYANSVTAGWGTVSGGLSNQVSGYYGTVAGGLGNHASANNATVAGGSGNQASAHNATVGGGVNNTAGSTEATEATVSGGIGNAASGGAAAVGGGAFNRASGQYATVGGGNNNTASGPYATVGGGVANVASIGVIGGSATVGGGTSNLATNDWATVPGGHLNIAGGINSFAAGGGAQALHAGTFVWGDNSALTTSTANNQFVVRASGGVVIYTSNGSANAYLAAGQTSWNTPSDRNAKKNFQPVDTVAVLDKLATIPIQQWNYKWENDTDAPNIGPVAQDFKQAFYPGRDDKGISTLEFDGVELAAIQGLNEKLNQKEARIQEQATQIEALKQSVAELKKLVQAIAEKK